MKVLKPESYSDIRSLWKPTAKTAIDPSDEAIATLGATKGWKELKMHIDSLKVGLDKRLAESVLSSLGSDQIKTDALFSVLGKELLDSIVNKVEDVTLAVDEIKLDNDRP